MNPTPTATDRTTTPDGQDAAALPEVRAMALWLAAHGTPVFPLAVGAKTPATPNGFKDATTDPAQIETWWARRPLNVGIATGPAGLLVIDLDVPKPGKPLPAPWADLPGVRDGADVLAVLAERASRPLPFDTRTVLTPSGGTHLYFATEHPLASTTGTASRGLGPLIDTRGAGGYVVAPPSRTAAGGYLTVHPGPIAPLPDWLADALTPPPTLHAPPPRPQPHLERRRDPYAFAAFEREVDAVLAARPGARNDTLNRAAYALGRFVDAGRLDRFHVHEALMIAGQHVGLSEAEARRTIASGLDAATLPAARPDGSRHA